MTVREESFGGIMNIKNSCSVLTSLFCLMCLNIQAEPVGLANAAFHDVEADGSPAGWRLNGIAFRSEAGVGVNGSRGLVWRGGKGSNGSCMQTLKLTPGRAYAFSAQIRTEGFSAVRNGATLCLEWYDSKGAWMAGGYVKGVCERNSDWVQIRGVTRDIPPEARECVLQLYVEAESGVAYFDNVAVEELARKPVELVYSSAYRDMQAEGIVRFHAVLNPPRDESGSEAFFLVPSAEGGIRRVRGESEDNASATCSVDVSRIPFGKNRIMCELVSVSGKKLGCASRIFERVRALPDRAVWIDEHHRCIVNGKPFFPIGLDMGGVTREKLEVYSKGPFNFTMSYASCTREMLDLCHEYGLMIACCVKDEVLGSQWARERGFHKQQQINAHLKDSVNRIKDHPAFFGWYVADEAPSAEAAARADNYRFFKSEDPNHPCIGCHDRTYDLRAFIPTFDILEIDPYPVPDKPIGHVTELFRDARKVVNDAIPIWGCPQDFDWSWYVPNRKNARFPTEAELRSINWQHIVNGANGLVGYCFHAYFDDARISRFQEFWDPVRRSYEEVAQVTNILLSVEKTPSVSGGTAEMPVRVWKCGKCVYVLVVNVAEGTRSAALSIDGPWKVGGTEIGSCRMKNGGTGNGFVVELDKLGVVLLRLERCGDTPPPRGPRPTCQQAGG